MKFLRTAATATFLTGVYGAALTLATGTATAQFTGKLVYQVVRPHVVLTMTYYQSGSMVHIEAYTMNVKKGVIDSSTLFAQDTILFDVSKGTETHLQKATHFTIITPYSMTLAAQAGYGAAISSTSVQPSGTGTINGYSCAHFIEKYTGGGPFGSDQRDVWATTTLGAPSILVVGSYLYYTPGSQRLQALNTAGCTGVIVQSTMSGQGQTTTMNLVSVDTTTPDASLFQVPAYYTIMDRSGYVPSKVAVKPAPPNKVLTPPKQ